MITMSTQPRLNLTLVVVAMGALFAPLTGACEDFSNEGDLVPCTPTVISCTDCHGDPDTGNPAPPRDTTGLTDTTEVTVGAHQSHLGTSDWHAEVQCSSCHVVPTGLSDAGHMDGGPAEVTWGPLAIADGASPTWDRTAVTCDGVYCHGSTLIPGGNRTSPAWTSVGMGQAVCGSCHGLPPDAPHPQDSACSNCHGMVVDSSMGFVDPSRHIDGVVDVVGATCNTCHGSATNAAPPVDTTGGSDTALVTVGAHQAHLASSTWHRAVQCNDCHVVPTAMGDAGHIDASPAEVTWGGLSTTDGATPAFDRTATTCDGVYCHGSTLMGANGGGTVARTPEWTTVDGTWDACGTTCHTNPPGGTHPANDQCETCHGSVIASYNVGNPAASVWTDANLHVDGVVQQSGYHDLPNWTAPKGDADHHGSNYFLTNQQRDEHDTDCTDCHGPNLDGGSSGVSCDNLACHSRDWRSCDFCHGTNPGQSNPPLGVGEETTTNTLAVGRHVEHLSAGVTHIAFACDNCHNVPAAGDVSHALQYIPSADLQTTGHHGDVALSGRAAGMTWDVTDTVGGPVTARGSCVGACHSDGNGGAPNVTPYWAGGSWSGGNCGNCHDSSPNTGEHGEHTSESCFDCHPSHSGGTHVDGTIDFNGPITFDPNGCGAGNPSCNGICHGKDHDPECW